MNYKVWDIVKVKNTFSQGVFNWHIVVDSMLMYQDTEQVIEKVISSDNYRISWNDFVWWKEMLELKSFHEWEKVEISHDGITWNDRLFLFTNKKWQHVCVGKWEEGLYHQWYTRNCYPRIHIRKVKKEFTLQQIADKMWVDLSELRIKN